MKNDAGFIKEEVVSLIVGIQNEILKIQSRGLLKRLLEDKTTKTNVIWGTDVYKSLGREYERDQEIKEALITGLHSGVIKNRARKELEQQNERTRQHAEVFTPLWICKKMNDAAEESWFYKSNPHPFDSEEKIEFLKSKKWTHYVDARRLEITCGEAPYLVSRYDVATGESIPIQNRVGILDRKLRVVKENTSDESEWMKWATRAFQATYGYEFQGDNLLIARVNLLMTFEEYMVDRWNRKPTLEEYRTIANIIAWNIWQMDGLTGTLPYCKAVEDHYQLTLFDLFGDSEKEEENKQPSSRIYDWRRDNSFEFNKLKEGGAHTMKFDFIIGNPPYQEVTESESTRMPPIYDKFMDEAGKVSDVVELITPARFLFNAGQTPKAWNEKMLHDPHFKVLFYEQDASKIFPNTDIKGGVAISYRNSNEQFRPIEVFVPYAELRRIKDKAGAGSLEDSLTYIADSSNVYDLHNIYADHPDYTKYIGDGGRHSQLKTNVLNINPIFTNEPTEDDDYAVYGLINKKRGKKYCHRRYLKSNHKSLFKYKVLVPKATGSGKFGDTFSEMIIIRPNEAFTQTYISIGMFETEIEARNLERYLKTKFARALLFVLKVTQDNLPSVWRYVPIQNFTVSSDIDWSKSISEIDQQLYAKYGLSKEEIDFIESHVKEME
ncbi:MAG: Eco57I restriction-modification methylase domain-containing protein [Eubacteriales bacterium]|nr:Eco57I restriction-modification methylase domain-containing protein [Eubacteriales bacterium]